MMGMGFQGFGGKQTVTLEVSEVDLPGMSVEENPSEGYGSAYMENGNAKGRGNNTARKILLGMVWGLPNSSELKILCEVVQQGTFRHHKINLSSVVSDSLICLWSFLELNSFRMQLKRWHPDKNPDNKKEAEEKSKEIMEAYKLLSNKNKRDLYDDSLKDIQKETGQWTLRNKNVKWKEDLAAKKHQSQDGRNGLPAVTREQHAQSQSIKKPFPENSECYTWKSKSQSKKNKPFPGKDKQYEYWEINTGGEKHPKLKTEPCIREDKLYSGKKKKHNGKSEMHTKKELLKEKADGHIGKYKMKIKKSLTVENRSYTRFEHIKRSIHNAEQKELLDESESGIRYLRRQAGMDPHSHADVHVATQLRGGDFKKKIYNLPLNSINSTMVDYYQALDIPQIASSIDIKKAYRKNALKWHPDKNPGNKEYAEKRFKEIAEAYEVLSDSKSSAPFSFHIFCRGYKRNLYDLYGTEGLIGASTGTDLYQSTDGTSDLTFTFRDADEVFREFFGEQDPFTQLFDDFSPFVDQDDSISQLIIPGGVTYSYYSYASPGLTDFFTTFGPGAEMGLGFHSISTTTKCINGKRITTKRIIETGQETVEIDEDGELKVAEVQDLSNNMKARMERISQEQPEVLSSAIDVLAPLRSQSAESVLAHPEDDGKDLHRAMASSLSEIENVVTHSVNLHSSKKRRGSTRRARKRILGPNQEVGGPLAIRAKSPGGGDNKGTEDKVAEGPKPGGITEAPRSHLVHEENDSALKDAQYGIPGIVPARRDRESVMCIIL
ncbi:uncharacterized protein LOC125426255 [Sphaerodactylus townsendi]|uniref:uncharacterized protein LOC125426255 n=1 Tax=Sphaerodactylus townsendi TaxID=933632 RepID=UPI002025EBCA|nr:uncharacterized protein LOC125426255 [Sphaerodactylus townsendi]